ncbi:AmmeMemoRadiSam system protein B [bacterium]|nr:AmmeMemoRadiSam system protein B [bacterium]
MLGDVPLDEKALETVLSQMGHDGLLNDEWLHKSEHSLELQLYWLQHILDDRPFTVLPFLAGSLPPGINGTPRGNEYTELILKALKAAERAHDGPVLWVASVDFAHVGPSFGDSELVSDSLAARVEKQDMDALQTLKQADPDQWWSHLMQDRNARRVCGQNAAWFLLRCLESVEGYVIDYDQALSQGRERMVSFASTLFL